MTDPALLRQFSQPIAQVGGGPTIIFVVITNRFENAAASPVARLTSRHKVCVLNNRFRCGLYLSRSLRPVEYFDSLYRIALLANSQGVTHDLVQIDEDIVTEQVIDLVLPRIVTSA